MIYVYVYVHKPALSAVLVYITLHFLIRLERAVIYRYFVVTIYLHVRKNYGRSNIFYNLISY